MKIIFCVNLIVNENVKQSMEKYCYDILQSKIAEEDFQNLKSSVAVVKYNTNIYHK